MRFGGAERQPCFRWGSHRPPNGPQSPSRLTSPSAYSWTLAVISTALTAARASARCAGSSQRQCRNGPTSTPCGIGGRTLEPEFEDFVALIRSEGIVKAWPRDAAVPRYCHPYLELDGWE